MLSPLVAGKIDVVLELISDEKKFLNITRRIRVGGEKPQVRICLDRQLDIQLGQVPR